MIETNSRLDNYPFALASELRDAANEHGFRIGPEQASGWIFFRSASAPGEIAVAAAGNDGPFFLSITHSGVARELAAEPAQPCAKGHIAAFALPTRDALFEAVGEVYRKSISLPTLPLEQFERETAVLGGTEIERIEKIRIGQGIFRKALLAYWKDTCPITGITDSALLRASHIVPWARCESDAERLNVHNGLLLSSLWDAAFDQGLISFDDEGRPIVSPGLSDAAMAALQPGNAAPLPLTSEHRARLTWHRTHLLQG
ncbi:HNH endonuclease [Bradyrhizobium sp. 1050_B9_N1_2]|uniref:HNH endonuclease n=1 Tax=Bradyrhizobium sp. 1050_B9_N1_2 TaxID=3238688 RepID=UPI003EDBA3A8